MKRTRGMWLRGLVMASVCVPVLAGAAAAPEPAQGEATATPEAPYVVKKGDTLWGISRETLQDPLLWPRVWEQNRFIADPNKIFPGDRLTLPGKQPAATPAPVVEAQPPAAQPTAAAPQAAESESESPKVEAQVAEPAAPPPAPPASVEAPPAPIPPVPPASRHAMVCSPALVAEKAATNIGSGEIVKSIDNRLMLSQEDRILLGMDGGTALKAGDRLAAIRVGRRVTHPQTGQSAGRLVTVLGLLEVTEVSGRVARARVSYSCGPMTVGDRVGAFVPAVFPEDKTPQPARRSVRAAIVGSFRDEALMGLQQVVFLDAGADQGIAPGDVFSVIRKHPPVQTRAGAVITLLPDRLGDAVVIRVADRTATALLTASSRDVQIGDQVVLTHQIVP